MTREQAINYLRSSGFSEEQIQEIVKALEQEPVLDKIRSEIEQRQQLFDVSIYYIDAAREQELSWVLELIDKYTSESEENV